MMIKLKNILTEKKELGGAKIHMIDMQTDRNNHAEARRLLAVELRNKKLALVYASIRDIGDTLGYMDVHIGTFLQKMDKELFKQAKKTYSDYDIIKGVF